MEIRRSDDRLISTMGFPILVRQHLYIESGPRICQRQIKIQSTPNHNNQEDLSSVRIARQRRYAAAKTIRNWRNLQGLYSLRRRRLISIGIPIINLRRSDYIYKQRVLMHRHQGWNVRHGLCLIYMRYLYIYELFIAFVCFVVCSLL